MDSILTVIQLIGPASVIIVGNALALWKNEAKILGEINRRHDVMDLKLENIKEQFMALEERVRKLESFKDDIYRSGIMRQRSSEE